MNGLAEHFRLSLRLTCATACVWVYGYLFPLIYLAACGVLFRHENNSPLVRHVRDG